MQQTDEVTKLIDERFFVSPQDKAQKLAAWDAMPAITPEEAADYKRQIREAFETPMAKQIFATLAGEMMDDLVNQIGMRASRNVKAYLVGVSTLGVMAILDPQNEVFDGIRQANHAAG